MSLIYGVTESGYYDGVGIQFDVLPSVNCDKLLGSAEIEACKESSAIEMAARICYESTVNHNMINKACAIEELRVLESTGVEMVYEGAKLDSFIEAAKTFFRNLWEKIQGMFKKVIMQFSSWFKSDKEFLKSYSKDIKTAINTKSSTINNKEFSGYDYKFYSDSVDLFTSKLAGDSEAEKTIDSVQSGSGSTLDAVKNLIEGFTGDKYKTLLDGVRGGIISSIGGSTGAVEKGDFTKEIKKSLQGGEDSKQTLKVGNMISKAMSFLENSENIKKELNNGLREAKKAIDDAIQIVEKAKRALGKTVSGDVSDTAQLAGATHTLCTKVITFLKDSRNIAVTASGTALEALKACSRQSKAICVKAVTAKVKKDKDGNVIESVVFSESAISTLNNIQLV